MAAARRLRFIADGLRAPGSRLGAQEPGILPAGTAARPEALTLSRPEPGRAADVPWELLTDSPGWKARDSQGEVAFDGKLWILGGWYESFAAPPRDVWSSSGGEWNKVTGEAGWRHSDL